MNAADGRHDPAMATGSCSSMVPSRIADGARVPMIPVYARRFEQAHRAIMPNDRYLGDAIRADREAGRYGR